MEKQLRTFSHTYCLEEEVLELKQHEDYLELITTKDTHYTKSVVLAIGNGSFQPRRLMIADADTFENHGIDYYINDLMKYAGKKGGHRWRRGFCDRLGINARANRY